MSTRLLHYQAYLLRFWEETQPTNLPHVWRFSLDDPRTGERIGFADLEHLLAYLNEQMDKPFQQEKAQ